MASFCALAAEPLLRLAMRLGEQGAALAYDLV